MDRGFDPNQVTFDQGLERIATAGRRAGLQLDGKRIVTSRQPAARKAQQLLTVGNVPGGFTKWQLPVSLPGASQLFVTVAEPDARVAEHSHDEGDGVRFIAAGSIIHDGEELTAGDWMYIPAGARYSFDVGPLGATMCYCYCCCCAGFADLFDVDSLADRQPILGP